MMTLTLTCHCGACGEWSAETFTELREWVTGLGWDVNAPTCPEHTT